MSTASLLYGGPVTWVFQTGVLLEKEGHTVHIVAADEPDSEAVKNSPLTVHGVGEGKGGYRYQPNIVDWAEKHVHEYDVVVGHSIWAHPFRSLAEAAMRKGVPFFAIPHGMLDPYFTPRFSYQHLKKSIYYRLYLRKILENCSGVIYTCIAERELARTSFAPYQVQEFVMEFGAEIDLVSPSDGKAAIEKILPIISDQPYFVFLSRIHPKKACDIMIEGFGRALADSHYQLVVAGPGPDELISRLKQIAASVGIADRVHFTGMLKGHEKAGALQGAQAFVLPSHQENFGIAIAEAMAYGTPVIISDKVNIYQEIQNEGAGLICHDEVESFSEALQRFIALSDEQKLEMGERAMQCHQKYFTIEGSAFSFLDIISGKPAR